MTTVARRRELEVGDRMYYDSSAGTIWFQRDAEEVFPASNDHLKYFVSEITPATIGTIADMIGNACGLRPVIRDNRTTNLYCFEFFR